MLSIYVEVLSFHSTQQFLLLTWKPTEVERGRYGWHSVMSKLGTRVRLVACVRTWIVIGFMFLWLWGELSSIRLRHSVLPCEPYLTCGSLAYTSGEDAWSGVQMWDKNYRRDSAVGELQNDTCMLKNFNCLKFQLQSKVAARPFGERS